MRAAMLFSTQAQAELERERERDRAAVKTQLDSTRESCYIHRCRNRCCRNRTRPLQSWRTLVKEIWGAPVGDSAHRLSAKITGKLQCIETVYVLIKLFGQQMPSTNRNEVAFDTPHCGPKLVWMKLSGQQIPSTNRYKVAFDASHCWPKLNVNGIIWTANAVDK